MESSLHRYDRGMLAWDYVRAGAGAAICLAPLAFVETATVMVAVLALLGAVFVVYGLRTALRHRTTVHLSATGLDLEGPWRRRLAWHELRGLKLAYYSTRRLRGRDHAQPRGWMELTLAGDRTRIAFDESLSGFDLLVASAFQAAQANGVPLSAVTRANLSAMGFEPPAERGTQAAV